MSACKTLTVAGRYRQLDTVGLLTPVQAAKFVVLQLASLTGQTQLLLLRWSLILTSNEKSLFYSLGHVSF